MGQTVAEGQWKNVVFQVHSAGTLANKDNSSAEEKYFSGRDVRRQVHGGC